MTDTPPENDRLLSVSAAARRLGVNRETIRRWVRKGAISYVELGPHKRKKLRQFDVDQQRRVIDAA